MNFEALCCIMEDNKPYLSLGEAIEHFFRQSGLRRELQQHQVKEDWEGMMGKAISAQTEALWFEGEVLHVRVSSPVWKQELTMARLKIRDLVNQRIGEELVSSVEIH
jgi:predicted nucleic acid-binding Zn ribbon protein